jgi:transposase InsO family protein
MKERIHRRLGEGFVVMVLEAFNKGRISEVKACELLGLKRARLYQLRKRWLLCLAKGEPFNLWGRKENAFHRFSLEVERWLKGQLHYIRDEADIYRGRFNFAFLSEEAEKEFGYFFHRNSFRRFALREGYYHALPDEKGKVYTRFETSGPGALFQHDTSPHLWIPLLGGRQHLILTEDDYSRMVVGGRLVERETSWEHLQVARKTIETFGLPLAYYVDQHSIFRFVGHQGVHVRYTKEIDEGDIQFRRALRSLDIGVIYAADAESKGKIEKRFDYFQRRLPYLCEKKRIRKIEDAQSILDELVEYYNTCRLHQETGEIPQERLRKAIAEGKGKLKTLDVSRDLDYIFSLQYERTVKKDGTISFQGRRLKIGRFPCQKVTMCLLPGKKIIILKDGQKIYEEHL